MSYPLPENEADRLKALSRLHILDTDPEEEFDQVADTAREFLGLKYAAVNFISDDSQWSKADCGIDLDRTAREHSFCARAVAAGEMLVVDDPENDERFADNPLVTGSPHIRFYAGAPLTVEGYNVGTLCVFDDEPHSFTEQDRTLLSELATLTSELLKARLQTYRVHYLSSALEQVDEPVFIVEGTPDRPEDVEITWVNSAYAAFMGEEREDLLETGPWIFEDLDDDSETKADLRRALEAGEALRGETSGRYESGEPYFVAWLLAPVRDSDGQVTHWVAVQRDVTERRVREEQLEYEASHDPLTGLLNRSAIEARIQRALTTDGGAGSLLYLDLDKFKQVNDTYGHSAGDQLLKQVARVLEEALREQDAVGRIGGDEFVVWFSPPITADTAEQITRRIIKAFDEPFEIQGEALDVDFSIGLVRDITAYETADAALEDADVAMYEAKQSPDQTFVAHDPAEPGDTSSQRPLNPMIQEAADEGGFETFLHPIVQLSDGSLAGFEVLARWRRHNGELAPPDDFLEVAEETGLIVPIGRQVLEGGCQALQQLRNGTVLDLSVTLSGNFSRREFFREETYAFIDRMLDTYDLPPENFTMEITERVTEDEAQNGAMPVEKLKSLGVSVEIDDFGTGYSSLRSLLEFPADGLKIDKGLTREIAGRDRGYHVARSVIEMARSLDLYVTAEGIETTDQLSVLQELDCQYGQGYLFSEPVPVEEAEPLADTFPRDLSSL
ncbi:MAG: putative bifunctional diguanylate cyclase/phosphodiesterase [Salinibacter sp.]